VSEIQDVTAPASMFQDFARFLSHQPGSRQQNAWIEIALQPDIVADPPSRVL
jgi:hypothetical protein